jgi:hypothetical protein
MPNLLDRDGGRKRSNDERHDDGPPHWGLVLVLDRPIPRQMKYQYQDKAVIGRHAANRREAGATGEV